MEQADIPICFHSLQELVQGARALWKFEAIQVLIFDVCAPAHHVANVQARHIVAGQIRHREAVLPEFCQDHFFFRQTLFERDADKEMSNLVIGIAVNEFGDAAQADGFAKFQETARPLGNRDAEQGLLLFTHGCALGNMPQAGEIHIGPG